MIYEEPFIQEDDLWLAWFAKPCAVAIDKASLAMMFGPECCSVLEKREIAGLQGATGRMAGSLTTCDNSGGDWNSRMVNFPKVFCSSPQPCEFSGQVESLGRPVNPIWPVVHVAPQVWPWVRSWSQAGTCNYLSQEKIIGKVILAKKEAHETDILSKYVIEIYREFVLYICMPRIHDMFVYISVWKQGNGSNSHGDLPQPIPRAFSIDSLEKVATMSLPPSLPFARNFLWHAISLCHTDWHRLDGTGKTD